MLLCLTFAFLSGEVISTSYADHGPQKLKQVEGTQFQQTRYRIFSDDEDIGSATVSITKHDKGYTIAKLSHINIDKWWLTLDIQSYSFEFFDINNTLLNGIYHTLDIDDDEHDLYWVELDIQDKGKIQWLTQKAMNKISVQESIRRQSYLHNALQIPLMTLQKDRPWQLSRPNGEAQDYESIKLATGEFEVVLNQLPMVLAGLQDKQLPGTLTLLDTEFDGGEIINKVSVLDLGFENIMIRKQQQSYRHIQLIKGEDGRMDIWLDTAAELPRILKYVEHYGDDTVKLVMEE